MVGKKKRVKAMGGGKMGKRVKAMGGKKVGMGKRVKAMGGKKVGMGKRVKAMKGKRVKAMGGTTMKGKRVKARGGNKIQKLAPGGKATSNDDVKTGKTFAKASGISSSKDKGPVARGDTKNMSKSDLLKLLALLRAGKRN